jgi:hypothetical protein
MIYTGMHRLAVWLCADRLNATDDFYEICTMLPMLWRVPMF